MAGGQFKLNKTAFTESNQDLVDVSQDEILSSYVNELLPRNKNRLGSSARSSVLRNKRSSSGQRASGEMMAGVGGEEPLLWK